MISREDARAIVDEYLRKDGSNRTTIGPAVAIDERPRILPYWPHKIPLQECWIVFIDSPLIAITSSTVAIVAKESGDILYVGSASDEG
jgi:hypothetical protein